MALLEPTLPLDTALLPDTAVPMEPPEELPEQNGLEERLL